MKGRREGPESGAPAWACCLVAWSLPAAERAEVLEEMDRLYVAREQSEGRSRARRWYVRHAVLFPVRLAAESVRRKLWSGRTRWAALRTGPGAGLAGDLRLAARGLIRRPSYAWAVVLTLGVGLGGTATVYNAANWVLLRPVPGVGAPEGLATLRLELGGPSSPSFPVSAPDLEDVAESLTAAEAVAGSYMTDVNVVTGAGADPRRMRATVATAAYFPVLRVSPAAGRLLDSGTADAREVVVSHGLWRREWSGSRAAMGATIRVNGEPFTVVGVAPEGFRGAELPGEADLWFPATAAPVLDPDLPADVLAQRSRALFDGLTARIADGATASALGPQFEAAIERIRLEAGGGHSFLARFRVGVYDGIGLSPRVRGSVGRTLTLLAGAAALLLLLAVANVANLALARVLGRSDSNGVRMALGATRRRVARGILVDHMLLSAVGGAVGLLLAWAATRVLGGLSLSSLGASLEGIHLEHRVVAFTLGAAVLAGLAAGVLPALAATVGRRLLGGLNGRRPGARWTGRVQTGMAGAQVALSVVLVVAAGLLVRTVVNLQDVDLGFEPAGAVRFAIDPGVQGLEDEEVASLLERLRAELAGRPGVDAVGYSAFTPLGTGFLAYAFWPEGRSEDDDSYDPIVAARLDVSAGFVEAMGARLVAGRTLRPEEVGRPDSDPVPVVISRATGAAVFPGLPPGAVVGRTFIGSRGRPVRVVGVVENPLVTGPGGERAPPVVFLPWTAPQFGATTLWVRGGVSTAALAREAQAAVRAVDPTLPVFDLRTVEAQVHRLIVEQRVVGGLALALAGLGLLLAAIGLNGLLWYTVAQRRREIGVRAALGASPARLARTTARRGIAATAVGSVLGGAGAVAAGRIVEARLFGVETMDPGTYALAASAIALVAVLASWAPARQATRIAPREALNAE